MPVIKSEDIERTAVMQTAKLMIVSARTAPKSGGYDDIVTAEVTGSEKSQLAAEMNKIWKERNVIWFKQDAEAVQASETVILVGVRGSKSFGLNCGACRYANCKEFDKAQKRTGQDYPGPNCAFKTMDLGIALGSAVKTASTLNIDNRLMYTIGPAARRLKMLPEASIIIGIPLSAKGKNIYFDRTN